MTTLTPTQTEALRVAVAEECGIPDIQIWVHVPNYTGSIDIIRTEVMKLDAAEMACIAFELREDTREEGAADFTNDFARSEDSKYHHEPKPAMNQPQDQNDELKERLAGVPECALFTIQTIDFKDHSKVTTAHYPVGKICHAAHKRIVELEKEIDSYKRVQHIKESKAEIDRLKEQSKSQWITDRKPTKDDAWNGGWVLVFQHASVPTVEFWYQVVDRPWLGRRQLGNPESLNDPATEPAWVPKWGLGDKVRTNIPGRFIHGKEVEVVHIARAGVYQAKLYDGSMSFFYETELEPIPWSLTPPPFGKWHRSDGWKEEWIKDGWRPLMEGEIIDTTQDWRLDHGTWNMAAHGNACSYLLHMRTKRPLPSAPEDPAEKAWKEWTKEGKDFTAKSHFIAGWNARSEG